MNKHMLAYGVALRLRHAPQSLYYPCEELIRIHNKQTSPYMTANSWNQILRKVSRISMWLFDVRHIRFKHIERWIYFQLARELGSASTVFLEFSEKCWYAHFPQQWVKSLLWEHSGDSCFTSNKWKYSIVQVLIVVWRQNIETLWRRLRSKAMSSWSWFLNTQD